MSTVKMFKREDGLRRDLTKEHGIAGFSIIDSTNTLRGKPGLMRRKSVLKRFKEISDGIDATDEPQIVKRTAKAILKDFIEHEVERIGRFLVNDKQLLIVSLIYYSRVINNLPAKKPPKVDKRLKTFLFTNKKYSRPLKEGIINRRSVYIALMSSNTQITNYVNNEIYTLSSVLEKYVKNTGNYSTKTIVGAILYEIMKSRGWPQEDVIKLFTVLGILKYNARTFHKNNPEYVKKVIGEMRDDDIATIEDSLRRIVEKISGR